MLELSELRTELERRGISAGAYSLGEPFKDNSLCLHETAFLWEIFFYERGERSPVASAPQFSDAAVEFLRLILSDVGALDLRAPTNRIAPT